MLQKLIPTTFLREKGPLSREHISICLHVPGIYQLEHSDKFVTGFENQYGLLPVMGEDTIVQASAPVEKIIIFLDAGMLEHTLKSFVAGRSDDFKLLDLG
jgi:hypothetical protein